MMCNQIEPLQIANMQLEYEPAVMHLDCRGDAISYLPPPEPMLNIQVRGTGKDIIVVGI